MKEDYLWDKSGNNPEIENLENTLLMFRQKETTPPELPEKSFVITKTEVQQKKWVSLFSLRTAAVACIALVVVSFAIFQYSRIENNNLAQKASETPSKENPVSIKNTTDDNHENENLITAQNISSGKPKITKRAVKVKRRASVRFRYRKATARNFKPQNLTKKTKIIKLTLEEKEAYDQLMKALAITSSQLQIARNKIRGTEEKSVLNKTRR